MKRDEEFENFKLPNEMEAVLKNPFASHALVSMLIEDGVKLNIDLSKLNHEDRSLLIKRIYFELSRTERLQ